MAEGTQDYVLPISAVPTGLLLFSFTLPRISSWATFSRPCGTHLDYVVRPDFQADVILTFLSEAYIV
jgi:hypothetical protein